MSIFAGARVCLALDASGVCGARVAPRLRGAEALAWARAPLPVGALVPHPVEPNLIDGEAVRQALSQVAQALDLAAQAPVRLVLPDGLARLVLLDEPRGVARDDFALFRLGPGLPFAAEEAVVGTLAAGRGRLVAGALRRSVGAEYEQAARDSGLVADSVFLAPLVALSSLLRQPPAHDEVALVLGDTSLLLAAFREGRLRVVRTRRRDGHADEPRRLADEAERTATAADLRTPARVGVHGSGARALAATLGLHGHLARVGPAGVAGLPDEAADWAWLAGAAA